MPELRSTKVREGRESVPPEDAEDHLWRTTPRRGCCSWSGPRWERRAPVLLLLRLPRRRCRPPRPPFIHSPPAPTDPAADGRTRSGVFGGCFSGTPLLLVLLRAARRRIHARSVGEYAWLGSASPGGPRFCVRAGGEATRVGGGAPPRRGKQSKQSGRWGCGWKEGRGEGEVAGVGGEGEVAGVGGEGGAPVRWRGRRRRKAAGRQREGGASALDLRERGRRAQVDLRERGRRAGEG
jgi:hypothetical protein